ncbi:heavy-metal-associated domain-containing protein [Micrococcus sp.]|uniref:heavy-metal-associated domain-containing protein n=1 Tax=Micrococcus sp. TaxID=1271 RepID=UPI002A90C2FD|nr:heavy-metal-associated domain-containing protein [Micrococcus sp.]MDY6054993.1 heavy-metal-associated domain-containing protein [Micrococcus sp.]
MTTTSLKITGMTCGHCVASVKEEISEVPGVTGVDVDLQTGSTSTATITSEGPVDEAALRAAVREAGYETVEA